MKARNASYKNDYYTRRAHSQGYVARSVFKLMELQDSYTFMRFGQCILDIGAAPGSWSQYCSRVVGDAGRVVSVDIAPITLGHGYQNVTVITGDFFSEQVTQKLASYRFHGVLSDISPRTTGNKCVDSCTLARYVNGIIEQLPQLLFNYGFAIFKIFESAETDELRKEMRTLFKRCYTKKPRASRAFSKEIYLIGFDYLHGKEIAAENQWEEPS